MSRLRRIALTDRIFFVTTNLQPKAAPFSPQERKLLLETLDTERRRRTFYLYGYVVMPSHLHLLVHPGEQALSDLMRNYKSKAALALVHLGMRRGPFLAAALLRFHLPPRTQLWREAGIHSQQSRRGQASGWSRGWAVVQRRMASEGLSSADSY